MYLRWLSPQTRGAVGGMLRVMEPDTALDFDVVMQGTVFLDIVLTGLSALPSAGTEIPAEGMGSCPGGIANLAIAASRLGLRTSLASSFGDDLYGDFLVRTLEEEGIDLSLSRRISQWHSPVTVSLAMARDRAMITHSHPSPVTDDQLIPRCPAPQPVWSISVRTSRPGSRRPGSTARCCSATSVGTPPNSGRPNTIEQLTQLHAFLPNIRRGDGLHQDRRSPGRADAAGRCGAGGGDHLWWAGRHRRRFDDRRGGMGALVAGERRRCDRRR